MSVSPYSNMLLKLPEPARSELFETKRHFPIAFLKGVISQIDELFPPEQTEDDTREIIQKKLKLCDFIEQYGEDFFELDKQGNAQIPDAIWEVMGARLDLLPPQEWGDDYSDEVKAIMADIFKLKNDPYPKEETYASDEGRFTYLVNIAYGSQEVIRVILAGLLNEEQFDNINRQFIQPTRTIEPSSSELEDYIIGNIRIIEFMLEHEGNSYLWPVQLIQDMYSSEDTVYVRDIIEKAEVSSSDAVKGVFATLINIEAQSGFMSSAEAIYTVLQFKVGPLKALKDFHDEIPEDIIIFGLVADYLSDSKKRHALTQVFGQDFVDQHMSYLSFIANNKKESSEGAFDTIKDTFQASHGEVSSESPVTSQNLSPEMQGLLLDFMVARDFVEMERINLALNQDPISVPNIHDALIQMKATLLKIRNDFMRAPHPMQSEDLRDFIRDLQADTWVRFDFVSRIHHVGRTPIRFVNSDDGPGPDTP